MSKIMGSWSGMRKHLENEMLADSLRGRVRYNCTSYPGMDDCKIFEVFIDDKCIKRFSLETVNTYFIENGLSASEGYEHPMSKREYWSGFWETLGRIPPAKRTEYTDEEFCNALEIYRGGTIGDSLHSENPIVKMFAILDSRVGKRTLINIPVDREIHPEWLSVFYKLRFEAEKI